MAQRQDLLERHALRLAAAWSDFDMVEQSAAEIVRRFGAIEPNDHGVLRLHKQPLFTALQTACVIGYTRPFAEGSALDPKYRNYPKTEWQDLHEVLFVWNERLCGDLGTSFRQFMVTRHTDNSDASDRFILGEATPVLEPRRHFAVLREMCADRKALLWQDLQDAITECYPVLYNSVLLGLAGPKSRL